MEKHGKFRPSGEVMGSLGRDAFWVIVSGVFIVIVFVAKKLWQDPQFGPALIGLAVIGCGAIIVNVVIDLKELAREYRHYIADRTTAPV